MAGMEHYRTWPLDTAMRAAIAAIGRANKANVDDRHVDGPGHPKIREYVSLFSYLQYSEIRHRMLEAMRAEGAWHLTR